MENIEYIANNKVLNVADAVLKVVHESISDLESLFNVDNDFNAGAKYFAQELKKIVNYPSTKNKDNVDIQSR